MSYDNFMKTNKTIDSDENSSNKLSEQEKEMIQNMCLDDSTKIIRYLEEKERKNHKREIANLIMTVIAAVCGILSVLPDIIRFFMS